MKTIHLQKMAPLILGQKKTVVRGDIWIFDFQNCYVYLNYSESGFLVSSDVAEERIHLKQEIKRHKESKDLNPSEKIMRHAIQVVLRYRDYDEVIRD